jgi:hypothetical protein
MGKSANERVNFPPDILQEVYDIITDPEGSGWPGLHHLGLGLGLVVRNTLRSGGFGWDDRTLDGEWAGLIAEAARRYGEEEQ